MRTYDSYKDSGIEWIGEIPRHWELKRLKYISEIIPSNVDKHIYEDEIQVELCNYTDVYKNDKIDSNTILSKGSCNSSEYDKYHVKLYDVIITKDSESPDDIGIPCLISEQLQNVICGYHLTILRPTSVDGRHLFRYLLSNFTKSYFCVSSNGMTRYGLGKSSIEDLFTTLPPLSEQEQIVSYLDEKTSLIDEMVEKKKRKIELLKEYRTSLINTVVTKGLNPDVPKKDSGIEWIGEIPRHWVVGKLGFYTSKIGSGLTPKGGSEIYSESGIPFIRSQNVHFQGLVLDNVSYIDIDIHNSMSGSKVSYNDVLLNITGGSIGRCCVVQVNQEMNVNQHVCIIRTNNKLSPYYLNYLLSSTIGQSQVTYNISGGNREGLTVDGIKDIIIDLPPFSEQEQIVSYLDEKTGEIDKTIELENKKIELLKEYRQSLISNVVTGKIKVTIQ
jgi:type I restriction enzyme S subunit